MPRASAAAALVAAALAAGAGAPLAAAAPAPAAAGARVQVCAKEVALRDAPRGIVVGHLRRPERVAVLQRPADRAWVRVRTTTGRRGWLPAGALCRR